MVCCTAGWAVAELTDFLASVASTAVQLPARGTLSAQSSLSRQIGHGCANSSSSEAAPPPPPTTCRCCSAATAAATAACSFGRPLGFPPLSRRRHKHLLQLFALLSVHRLPVVLLAPLVAVRPLEARLASTSLKNLSHAPPINQNRTSRFAKHLSMRAACGTLVAL